MSNISQEISVEKSETVLSPSKSIKLRISRSNPETNSEEKFDEFVATDEKEEFVASVAYQLYSQKLLPELFKLLDSVMPKLSPITQQALETDVLAKLQDYEP